LKVPAIIKKHLPNRKEIAVKIIEAGNNKVFLWKAVL